MRRWSVPLALAFLAAATLLLSGPARAELRVLKGGEKLAPRALKGLEGDAVTVPAPFVAGEKGVTVVVFWATWSPRSAPLLALWQKLSADYSSRPVRVVTINADHQEMDSEKLAAVRGFLRDNQLTLPTAIDERLSLYNELGVIALPTTLFFGADGSLSYEEPGFPSSAAFDMPEELDRELGIARAPEEEKKERGKIAGYQPKNNALLFFNMGVNLQKIKMREKARGKFLEALGRDPDYPDPLLALEEDFFREGRTPPAVEALREYLVKGNLPAVAERVKD